MAETKESEKRKKSKEYWKKRASQREREAYARGSALSARLYRQYEKAAVQIRKEINDWYMRYAKENKLTYDQAVKLLSRREMQEWKRTIGQYVDQINSISDEAIKAKMKSQLDALSYNSSITRLESLYSQIDAIMSDTFARGVDEMKAEFGEAFRQGYYKKLYDIQNRVGYMQEIAHIGPKMIENVVSYPWTGVMFSDRIWHNKEALIFNMREIITQGLIQGKSIASMSKQLADNMGRSYKAAERVIRTETNHFHNEAEKHAYLASGIKEYEYMATLDSRTCEACGKLDGKHFPVAEARPGENFPPLHPSDRCTTIEYDPEDAVDWVVSGQPMPKNMTYEAWAKQQNVPVPEKDDARDSIFVG